MNDLNIFLLQFLLSIVVYAVVARLYVTPWLAGKSPHEALSLLILPHAFRHIGMTFLVSNVVHRPLPTLFSYPAAYGDLAAGALALIAIVALQNRWSSGLLLVWIFNIVGSFDLMNALFQGLRLGVIYNLGATWFVPTFLVPALLVSHVMIFNRMVKP